MMILAAHRVMRSLPCNFPPATGDRAVKRRWLLFLGALLIGMVLPGTPDADAHYKDSQGRWAFYGGTFRDSNGDKRADPVNVMWYPYAYSSDASDLDERVQDHLQAHWLPRWKGPQITNQFLGLCRGSQYMNFRGTSDYPANDTQGVGYVPGNQSGNFETIPSECGNRYHARLWYDTHTHTTTGTHSARQTYLVGNMHHEAIVLKGECKRAPIIGCRPKVVFNGHKIDKSSEMVEWATVKKMRARPRDSSHRDPFGDAGGHCSDYDWKRLPGSAGKTRYGGQRSDGMITRISLRHGTSPQCLRR